MAQFIRKKVMVKEPGKPLTTGSVCYADEDFIKKYPALLEFLAEEFWDESTPRQRGTLLIFAEEGMFKACLNDRDADVTAFIAHKGFKGLLDTIEKKLRDDTLEWRGRKPSTFKRK